MPFTLTSTKATRSQVRRHNRELVLRSVYTGAATSRVALAQETGLTKPAISDLVSALIEDGLLAEDGFGESSEGGGKKPRLLRFVPDARQVIGISIHLNRILAVLTNLDGRVIAEHAIDLPVPDADAVLPALTGAIHGLVAQLSAPLLCIGVGIPAIIAEGRVLYAPRLGWRDVDLGAYLNARFAVPVHMRNSGELAALAQIGYGDVPNVDSLVTIMVSNSVGVGAVLRSAAAHFGSEIGHLHLADGALQDLLGWEYVRGRAHALGRQYGSTWLARDDVSYLHIRYAAVRGDTAAGMLCDELAGTLARVFAWVVGMLHPQHVSLAGAMAELGEPFLQRVIACTRLLLLPELVAMTTFSVDITPNLVALGAAAHSVQVELGLL